MCEFFILNKKIVLPWKGLRDLKPFVLDYSVCPTVHEIQIIWLTNHYEIPSPEETTFKYKKTHSKVTFHKVVQSNDVLSNLYSNIITETSSKNL